MKLHKKGFFADPIADAWAFITYVLIIIIFFIIFSFGKGEIKVEIKEDMGDVDAYIVLRDFLRTPYNDKLNAADLVALFNMEKNDDYDAFVRLAQNFFNKQYEGWELRVIDLSDQSSLKILPSMNQELLAERTFLAYQIIPGFHDTTYRIELYSREVGTHPSIVH